MMDENRIKRYAKMSVAQKAREMVILGNFAQMVMKSLPPAELARRMKIWRRSNDLATERIARIIWRKSQ